MLGAAGSFGSMVARTSIADCYQCPPNSTAENGSITCLCIEGYYDEDPSPFGSSCAPCPKNTYNNKTGMSTPFPWLPDVLLLAQPISSHAGAIDISECIPCPGGGLTEGNASSALSQCQCGQGAYGQPTKGIACQMCPANTYNSRPGQAKCENCTRFAISPEGSLEVSSCRCISGYYGVISEGGNCTKCPAQSSSPVGSLDILNCSCNVGFSGKPSDGLACKECGNLSYPHVSSEYCSCNAGYYGPPGGSCERCPAGSTSPNASTSVAEVSLSLMYRKMYLMSFF